MGVAAMSEIGRERIYAGPQPPFSNKEGIIGLETGLKLGIPVFSVVKWNMKALIMTTYAPGENATACFLPYWLSYFIPLPPEALGGEKDIYTKYMAANGLYGPACNMLQTQANTLVYDKFVVAGESQQR